MSRESTSMMGQRLRELLNQEQVIDGCAQNLNALVRWGDAEAITQQLQLVAESRLVRQEIETLQRALAARVGWRLRRRWRRQWQEATARIRCALHVLKNGVPGNWNNEAHKFYPVVSCEISQDAALLSKLRDRAERFAARAGQPCG